MKNYLLLFLLSLGGASLANAAIIFTSPCFVGITPATPSGGPQTSGTCSVQADAGFFIDSISVDITSDYSGNAGGAPTVTNVYTFVLNDAGFGAIPNGVVTTDGLGNSVKTTNFSATLAGNFGSLVRESFSMTDSVTGGTAVTASGVMRIFAATEAPIVVGGVPEPATLGLVGGALLGLGALSRRKKRS